MFLCERCHAKTPCRSEVHLDIIRRRCEACLTATVCINCRPVDVLTDKRSVMSKVHLGWYRNTTQLSSYKKIDI